jgi:hypothetical protein
VRESTRLRCVSADLHHGSPYCIPLASYDTGSPVLVTLSHVVVLPTFFSFVLFRLLPLSVMKRVSDLLLILQLLLFSYFWFGPFLTLCADGSAQILCSFFVSSIVSRPFFFLLDDAGRFAFFLDCVAVVIRSLVFVCLGSIYFFKYPLVFPFNSKVCCWKVFKAGLSFFTTMVFVFVCFMFFKSRLHFIIQLFHDFVFLPLPIDCGTWV